MKFPTPIETLENRIAPAGLVLANYNPATGALELEGDGDANSISIFRTGISTFRVQGLDGTQVGTSEFLDTAKITSLSIDLGGGDDDLFLTGLSLASAQIDLGAGEDFLTADNFVVKGTTNLNFGADGGEADFGGTVTALGPLFITNTSGSSFTDFQAAATSIKGVLSLAGGPGSDEISSSGNFTAAKGLVVNGNGGDDTISLGGPGSLLIGKSSTGQSIEFNGGDGADSIFLESTVITLAGFIDFDAADGNNVVFLGGQSTVKVGTSGTGASIFYTGGTGADTVEIRAFSTTLAGGIDMDGGIGGFNEISIDSNGNLKLGKIKASGDSVALLGGADGDEIYLGGNVVTLAGGISLDAFGGSNTLDLDGTNVSIGKALDGRSLSLAGGNGEDTMDLEGARVSFKGELFFSGGGGNDELDANGLIYFTAASIFFEGGDDDDTFELESNVLNVGGDVEILGGDGNDDLNVFADGTIKGNVQIDAGSGDSDQFITFVDFSGFTGALRVLGNLELFSFGDDLSFDDVFLHNVSVGKITTIDLGDGGSFVSVDNLFAKGEVRIQTHGGEDTVEFERQSVFGPSVLSKPVTINLGAGADTLRLGDSTVAAIASHNRIRFLSTATIVGGDGTDSLNTDAETANSFSVEADIQGFE